MATHVCGYCQSKAVMRMHGEPHAGNDLWDGSTRWEAGFICDGCNNLSVAISTMSTNRRYDPPHETTWDGPWVHWFPPTGTIRRFPEAPEPIAECASEAFRCRSINANRGAVLLARTTIEATAKHYGIVSGNLKSKIDRMADERLVHPRLAEAAHNVRLLGNDQAHGDLEEPVTDEDADAVLTVMQGIFAATFEQDAAINHLKSRVQEQESTSKD